MVEPREIPVREIVDLFVELDDAVKGATLTVVAKDGPQFSFAMKRGVLEKLKTRVDHSLAPRPSVPLRQ